MAKRRIKKKYIDGLIGFCNVFLIGLMWIVFSLPVFTMGAASCAAYYCVSTVLGKERNVIGHFVAVYKQNMKVTLPLMLMILAFYAWLGLDIYVLHAYGTKTSLIMAYIVGFIALVAAAFYMYLAAFVQKFDAKRKTLFKLALYATFGHLPKTLVLISMAFLSVLALYHAWWLIFIISGPFIWAKYILIRHVIKGFTYEDASEVRRVAKKLAKADEEEELRNSARAESRVKRSAIAEFEDDEEPEEEAWDRIVEKRE